MRRLYWVGGVLLLGCSVLCWALFLLKTFSVNTVERQVRTDVIRQVRALPPETEETAVYEPPVSWQSEALPPETEEAAVYESPVDFQSLWEMNPDVYAWLYIPGTEINYPILRREGDDGFYLNHDSEGNSSALGAIFTESSYNGTDFTDPATVVYGHHARSGTIFGNLQKLYTAEGGMKEYNEIIVYLPERELHYRVFAAVPFNMRHILYYNDFSDAGAFERFMEQVLSVRSVNAVIDRETIAAYGDRLLILSTCLTGDRGRRYLVLAVLEEE